MDGAGSTPTIRKVAGVHRGGFGLPFTFIFIQLAHNLSVTDIIVQDG